MHCTVKPDLYHFLFILLLVSYAYGDLYNSSDPMLLLNNNNIYKTILGVENAWIIEFYNSWCGHCVNFVPTWREFARDIKEWDHTIKAAVLDCSDFENVPLCREYEVMSYPTVRLFGANLKKGDIGKNVKDRNKLHQEIIEYLIEQQESNNGSKSWVTLPKYKGPLKDIFQSAPAETKDAVVIVEKGDSHIGAEVAMDLGNYPMAYVRSIEEGSLEAHDVRSMPGIIILDKKGSTKVLQHSATTREELAAIIIQHLQLTKKMAAYNTKRTTDVKVEIDDMEGAGDGKPDEVINEKETSLKADFPSQEANKIVYVVDIENALSYAISQEISLHKVIDGERLGALKNFLHILLKFLPMRAQVHEFINKLSDYVHRHETVLHGEDFSAAIQFLNTEDSRLPEHQPWIGCRGSQTKYRGYPCSLWTLFHTLTVNAVLETGSTMSYDPKEVLRGIHGYVKHFFSCGICSKHFQEMYALDAESLVHQRNDAILWLWRGHNKVNKRIKGDLSEDPEHMKEPFPPKLFCPACWNPDDSFNEKEVLHYLWKIYGKASLSLKGTMDLEGKEESQNKQAKVFNRIPQKLMQPKDMYNFNQIEKSDRDISFAKNYAWGFTSTDVNLCVTLYVFSALIIMTGYSMFVLKKRLRRRKFLDKFRA